MRDGQRISEGAYSKLSAMYKELYQQSKQRLHALFEEEGKEWSHEKILLTLRKHALGMERFVYLHLFEQHALNETALAMLHGQVERQINRIERNLPQIREENEAMSFARHVRQRCLDAVKRLRSHRLQQWHRDITTRGIIHRITASIGRAGMVLKRW